MTLLTLKYTIEVEDERQKINWDLKMNKRENYMIYDHLVVFIRHGPVEIRRFRSQHALVKIWPAPAFSCLCFMNFRVQVLQTVDFLAGAWTIWNENFGRPERILDVRYALERSWASDQDEPGFSSRRRCLPIFFVSWSTLHHRPKH